MPVTMPETVARGGRRRRWGWRAGALLLAALVALLAAGCGARGGGSGTPAGSGRAGTSEEGARLPVVVTFYPLEYMARTIGGDRVAVTALIPPGADAHHWEPRPADVRAVAAARVFIYNGAGLEPWVPRLLAAAGRSDRIEVEASAGLPLVPAGTATRVLASADEGTADGAVPTVGRGAVAAPPGSPDAGEVAPPPAAEGSADPEAGHGDHGHGDPGTSGGGASGVPPDPHVWLDPALAARQARTIADALAQADPRGRAIYLQRGEELAHRLEELAADYRQLARCRRRELVVTHAFLTYPAHRYGLVQIPIYGLTEEREPGPRQLAAVAAFVRERDLPYIVVEPGAAGAAATLARETGTRLLEVHPLETLTAADRQAGRDFVSLLEQNLDRLRRALGCGG